MVHMALTLSYPVDTDIKIYAHLDVIITLQDNFDYNISIMTKHNNFCPTSDTIIIVPRRKSINIPGFLIADHNYD